MQLWLKNVNKEKLLEVYTVDYIRNNGRICGAHFEEKYFISTLKDRLQKLAVPLDPLPTLSDISSATNLLQPSTSEDTFCSFQDLSSTDTTLEKITSTPKMTPKTRTIRKLRCDISKLKRKLALKDDEMNVLQSIRSKVTAVQFDFICDQIELSQKDPRGRRWKPRAKAMAMNIFLKSKATYELLRTYFAFPCITTLKNSVGTVAQDVGFCPIIKKALKEKMDKSKPWEKFCSLVFDEMSIKSCLHYNAQLDCVDGWESAERDRLKELATQALVFMIRGITQNWKQVCKIPETISPLLLLLFISM